MRRLEIKETLRSLSAAIAACPNGSESEFGQLASQVAHYRAFLDTHWKVKGIARYQTNYLFIDELMAALADERISIKKRRQYFEQVKKRLCQEIDATLQEL
ncbi:hypothetical protein [Cesiribacter andamanensis]|uniref:Uncharacterized protein n=1 Tax=Cesiribacter andamanensis AMV16 TaxID=1279009 RepID=M7MY94_9BACT|nr:hypothetical protein [Cesiribacter andamanensis]EMR01413.1 hypothetical protein ADICEAN_03447 [Cesiribacter andamanensis AMV16]